MCTNTLAAAIISNPSHFNLYIQWMNALAALAILGNLGMHLTQRPMSSINFNNDRVFYMLNGLYRGSNQEYPSFLFLYNWTFFSMNAIHDIVYQSRLFFLSFFLAWLHIIYSRGVWPSTYTPLNNLFVPSLSHPLHVAINSDFRFKHQRSSCFTNNGTSTPSHSNAHPLLKWSLKPEHQSLKYPSLLGMDTELNLNTTGSNTLPCVTDLTLLNAGGSKPFNTGGICHTDRSQWTGRVRYKNSFRNINGNEYDLSTSYTHIHKCANMHI